MKKKNTIYQIHINGYEEQPAYYYDESDEYNILIKYFGIECKNDIKINESEVNKLLNDIEGTPGIFDLLSKIEYIEFCDESINNADSIYDFVANTPELKKYKIILPTNNLISADLNFMEKLSDYDIYVRIGSNNIVNVKDIEFYQESTKKVLDSLSKLSTFDKIMYIYDLIRGTVDKRKESLKYIDVLVNKFGYVYTFEFFLTMLGIKNLIVKRDNKNINIAYIKDEHYKINGTYLFDIEEDSQKKLGDDYIYTYKNFAICCYDEEIIPSDLEKFPSYLIEDSKKEEGDIKRHNFITSVLFRLSKLIDDEDFITSDYFFKLLVNKKLLENISVYKNIFDEAIEFITKKIQKYKTVINNPIKERAFLSAFFKIRFYQYAFDSKNYPLDIDSFYETVENSMWSSDANNKRNLPSNWDSMSIDERLDYIFSGKLEVIDDQERRERFRNYAASIELPEKIKAVKTLRKLKDEKDEND